MPEELAIANPDPSQVHTTDTSTTPEGGPQQTPKEPEQPDPVNEIFTTVGIDPSAFKDPDTAREQARQLVGRLALEGHARATQTTQTQPASPQQPAAVTPTPEPGDEDDDEEDDPLPGQPKKRKRKTKYERQLEQRLAALEQKEQQQLQQRLQAAQQQVSQRAVAALDSMQSGKYGVGATRNWQQVQAARSVLQTAEGLFNSLQAQGKNPSIEEVVNLAAFYEGEGPLAKQKKKEEQTATPGPPPEPRSGFNGLPGNSQAPAPDSPLNKPRPYGKLTSYLNDPQFRAASRALAQGR